MESKTTEQREAGTEEKLEAGEENMSKNSMKQDINRWRLKRRNRTNRKRSKRMKASMRERKSAMRNITNTPRPQPTPTSCQPSQPSSTTMLTKPITQQAKCTQIHLWKKCKARNTAFTQVGATGQDRPS